MKNSERENLEFGKHLRKCREKARLTAEKVASEVGLAPDIADEIKSLCKWLSFFSAI